MGSPQRLRLLRNRRHLQHRKRSRNRRRCQRQSALYLFIEAEHAGVRQLMMWRRRGLAASRPVAKRRQRRERADEIELTSRYQ